MSSTGYGKNRVTTVKHDPSPNSIQRSTNPTAVLLAAPAAALASGGCPGCGRPGGRGSGNCAPRNRDGTTDDEGSRYPDTFAALLRTLATNPRGSVLRSFARASRLSWAIWEENVWTVAEGPSGPAPHSGAVLIWPVDVTCSSASVHSAAALPAETFSSVGSPHAAGVVPPNPAPSRAQKKM